MNCTICGKPRGFIAALRGLTAHPECLQAAEHRKRAEAEARSKADLEEKRRLHAALMEQISSGKFRRLNSEAQMILDEGETCCVMIKGCWDTLFYARAAGRVLPGQTIRVDGLKKKDWGTLHVTDKRVCFVGRGGAEILAIKKLIQIEARTDVLHLTAQGRASSSYFIIESPEALEMAAAAIRKLTEMAKAGVKPALV